MPPLNNPFQFQGRMRDYYGMWTPAALESMLLIQDSSLYRPAWYTAPVMEQQAMLPHGYVETTLAIKPGSWIIGVIHNFVIEGLFQWKMTDLDLDHEFMNAPAADARFVGSPYLLPEPHPVIGSGNIRVEVWNPAPLIPDFTPVIDIILLVSEPVR